MESGIWKVVVYLWVERIPIVGAEISVYHIANVTINREGNLIYEYTKDFKKMNVAMEDAELVAKTDAYISHHNIPSAKQVGDVVVFTDVNGVVYHYEVELLETLPKDATKEMITSGFALSLYTCTPGGGNRVTVRCKTVQEDN